MKVKRHFPLLDKQVLYCYQHTTNMYMLISSKVLPSFWPIGYYTFLLLVTTLCLDMANIFAIFGTSFFTM